MPLISEVSKLPFNLRVELFPQGGEYSLPNALPTISRQQLIWSVQLNQSTSSLLAEKRTNRGSNSTSEPTRSHSKDNRRHLPRTVRVKVSRHTSEPRCCFHGRDVSGVHDDERPGMG